MRSAAATGPGRMRQHPLLALEQLASQCADLQEIQPTCATICRRLTALTSHLETHDDSTLLRRDNNDRSTEAFHWAAPAEPLIARFTRLVERNAHHNTIRRLTDVHRVQELYDLHEALDAAFQASRAEHVDTARGWRLQWREDVDTIAQQIECAALDLDILRQELGADENAQCEALALVKFAAENVTLSDTRSDSNQLGDDGDALAADAARRVTLLKRVFRCLLSVTAVDVPTVPEWFISPSDVALSGRAFSATAASGAAVYVGEWLPLAKPVLVKHGGVPRGRKDAQGALRREAQQWYPLNHPHVLKLLGGSHVSTPPFLVFEALGDDVQTLDAYASATGAGVHVLRALTHVAQALQYLHEEHRLAHLDVRCQNVLVSTDGRAMLSNVASVAAASDGDCDVTKGGIRVLNGQRPLRWAAPETLESASSSDVSFTADVYSFGMCVLEAMSGGDVPWGFTADAAVRLRVTHGELPPRDSSISSDVWTLITSMCTLDPTDRPTIASVVASLQDLVERQEAQLRSSSSRTGAPPQGEQQAVVPADYANYRHRLSFHSHTTFMSDTKSVASDTSSSRSKDTSSQKRQDVTDSVSVVTLHHKWLGVKINSIGTKIVVSKFLRAASGAMGEIEASGAVTLGDVICAVNHQAVRGMNRHQLGAFIQSTPRPLTLSFKRERSLLDDAFRFTGLRRDERWRDRGSVVPLPGSLDRLVGSSTGAFSLEFWFSLADAADTFLGGILLGAQDTSVTDDTAAWPYVHKQLVVVDPHGNLCVSVLTGEAPVLVARELSPSIWYHLVLTYSGAEQQLAVYLDGELRHESIGALHRDWRRLAHVNVGSGYISGLAVAKPTPDFTGWYGFHGLVHDFQLWRAVLSDLEVHQLFRGARDCVDIPSYSLRRDALRKTRTARSRALAPERVRASRPEHVVAQVY